MNFKIRLHTNILCGFRHLIQQDNDFIRIALFCMIFIIRFIDEFLQLIKC